MIGAFLIKPRTIEIREIITPEPGPGEVRICLQKTGICGSDVHLFLGHRLLEQPTIIGHEALGIVDKASSDITSLKVGDRVAIEPNIPCKHCNFCMSGRGNICVNKRVIGNTENGCFAEFITMPEEFCWKINNEISDDDAVTIEPAAVAYHALFSCSSKPGDAIAVIGLGAIGLLLTHLSLRSGYIVLVTDINENKLKLAAVMGAIPVTSNKNSEENISQLSKTFRDNNVSTLFECGGSAITASLTAATAPRGSEIILLGLSEKAATFQPLKIVREDIRIIPSIIYNHPFDFKRTIQLIQSKIIEPGKIISGEYRLDQLQFALEEAAAGAATKLIINI
jgi:L-iditol 2-dehydrogenase